MVVWDVLVHCRQVVQVLSVNSGQDSGGGVGLVSVVRLGHWCRCRIGQCLRLGYCWWYFKTCSRWHNALLSRIVGGLTIFEKLRTKAQVVVQDWLVCCGEDIGGGVGLVSALRLGHWQWCRISQGLLRSTNSKTHKKIYLYIGVIIFLVHFCSCGVVLFWFCVFWCLGCIVYPSGIFVWGVCGVVSTLSLSVFIRICCYMVVSLYDCVNM